MIGFQEIESIHNILIERFGGSKGIRDQAALESAIGRPFATFDGTELYPTATEKAAALFQSLIINHPFIDGNKRIAYVMMRLMLMKDNTDLDAPEEEKYQMVISASKGEMTIEQIIDWIKQHLK